MNKWQNETKQEGTAMKFQHLSGAILKGILEL